MVKTRSRLVNTVRRCALTQKLYLPLFAVRVQSPGWERGSVSVQAKPLPDAVVGVAPLRVRTASTVILKPATAAQLSLTGRMAVWMNLPPA